MQLDGRLCVAGYESISFGKDPDLHLDPGSFSPTFPHCKIGQFFDIVKDCIEEQILQ